MALTGAEIVMLARITFETGRLLGRALNRQPVSEEDIDAAFDRAAAADARWQSLAPDAPEGEHRTAAPPRPSGSAGPPEDPTG
jgi:hypothetical protein